MTEGWHSGLIVRALSGFYDVELGGARVYRCRARGIFKKDGVTPLVGDRVMFSVTDERDAEGVVEEVLPRANAFIRPPVANVGLFLVTVAAAGPPPDMELADRFLVSAEAAGADAAIVVNKSDLAPAAAQRFCAAYGGIYPAFAVSAKTGDGLCALLDAVRGRSAAFAGASGVGKTSLLAALLEMDGRAAAQGALETGGLSEKTGRGRHTTRRVEIFACAGGTRLFDTPGFSAFEAGQTADLSGADLAGLFPELRAYGGKCRFDDCSHTHEPGCAVLDALAAGRIKRPRYASYVRLLADAAAQKERKYR